VTVRCSAVSALLVIRDCIVTIIDINIDFFKYLLPIYSPILSWHIV